MKRPRVDVAPRLMLAITAVALLAAGPAWAAVAPEGVRATVRTSRTGTPHVDAANFRSAGYALGWSQGHDATCVLAESYVTVRGERSRFFGPDGTYDQSTSNGTTPTNLDSDLFFGKVREQRTVERLLERPDGPRPEVRDLAGGFVDGYNAALEDLDAPDGIRDPACRGAEWVRPITALDAWRRIYQLATFAGQNVAMSGIAGAAPPLSGLLGSAADAEAGRRQAAALRSLTSARFDEPLGGLGSNAIALGGESTVDGRGMLLGNPHFPWRSSERFYQAHVRIPGRLDVAGAGILGAPLVLYGFNRDVAWTTTVSTARRFVPYQLVLVPGDPTAYLVDGRVRRMRATPVTVAVRRADGTVGQVRRTLYDSEYGPIITSLLGQPLFPWTPATAYALFDPNEQALGRVVNHYLELNRSTSVRHVMDILRTFQGPPFNTTEAADARGDALFADIGSIPNVDTDRYASCNTPLGLVTDDLARVVVLDGASSRCAPGRAPGAAADGILPPDRQPSIVRRDVVANSNDSHWFVTPKERLTGFSRIIGPEAQPQLFRTRIGMRMVLDRLREGPFTARHLMDLVFANRNVPGELWRDDLVALCEDEPRLEGSRGTVDVSEACRVLRDWDLRDDLDSRGSLVVRLTSRHVFRDSTEDPFRIPFDPVDPVGTPAGLDTSKSTVRRAFADAVQALRDAGVPLDARLRDWQYVEAGGRRIPLHGASDGVDFNVVEGPLVFGKGYADTRHGSSYTQVVHLGGRCPRAHAIQVYSQSPDPTSRHFADQTALYAQKRWLPFPLCREQVRRLPGLRVTRHGGGFDGPSPLVAAVGVRRRPGRILRVRLELKEPAQVTAVLRRNRRRVGRTAQASGRTVVLRLRLPRGNPRGLAVALDVRGPGVRQRLVRRVR